MKRQLLSLNAGDIALLPRLRKERSKGTLSHYRSSGLEKGWGSGKLRKAARDSQ